MEQTVSLNEIETLDKLPITGHNNGGKIFIRDKRTLIKLIPEYVDSTDRLDNPIKIKDPIYSLKVNHIRFLSDKKIPHAVLPRDIYNISDYDGIAYSEDYINDATTFKSETVNRKYTFSQKMNAVSNVFEAIRNIHKYGVIGDIHLDNFLCNRDGAGFVIDLDDLRINKEYIDFIFYLIRLKKMSRPIDLQNENIDNIKAAICALSFIYGINFETMVRYYSLDELVKCLKKLDIKNVEQFKKVLTTIEGEFTYFDELLPYINSDEMDERARNKIGKKI